LEFDLERQRRDNLLREAARVACELEQRVRAAIGVGRRARRRALSGRRRARDEAREILGSPSGVCCRSQRRAPNARDSRRLDRLESCSTTWALVVGQNIRELRPRGHGG
jgi:hypothetical protein